MALRIGTSGWNYPSGEGTWNGLFYPKSRSKRAGTAGFDELQFYAQHFDTVEVNSTFYGQPRADVTAAWARRTPDGFEFSLKLYQKFTHPKMFREAALRRAPGVPPHGASPGPPRRTPASWGGSVRRGDPGAEGPLPVSRNGLTPFLPVSRNGLTPFLPVSRNGLTPFLLDLLAEVTSSDIDDFRAGIEPLANAGRLGALLAQFPPSFKDTPATRDYLAHLLRAFSDYPVAVELRHRSWSDAIGETLAMLNGFGAAWVQIDEPKFCFSIRQNYLPNVTSFYYMRLHGRNVAQWWHHEHRDDRYNYLYSAEELNEFSEIAGAANELVKKSYLYTNNHFSAKSVVNAVMLKAQLGQPIEGEYPPELVSRYPELAQVVTTRPTSTPSRLPVG
jgi:uncharacterized protein YecE (DUF72 family)